MQVCRRLLLCTLIQPLAAWAVDLQPNDIVAPLPGKNHAMISYINTENTTFYRNGSAANGSPDIGAQTAILRLVTSYTVKDLPAVSFIQLPYGSIKPGGSLGMYPTATGVGDLTLASAFWPYSDRVNRRYFGVAGYLTMPTGSYNSQQPLIQAKTVIDPIFRWAINSLSLAISTEWLQLIPCGLAVIVNAQLHVILQPILL